MYELRSCKALVMSLLPVILYVGSMNAVSVLLYVVYVHSISDDLTLNDKYLIRYHRH